jgi:hypothetical protein
MFFGFLGCSLLVLLVVHVVATEYLRGRFYKEKESQETNILLETGQIQTGSPYKKFSNITARGEIQQSGSQFASKAVITVSLEYFQNNKHLVGVVKTVENWDKKASDVPKQVKFTAKTLPRRKYTANTPSKGIERENLAVSFLMGPVVYEEILNESLCIQMLGKRKRLGKQKWKCYGECYIELNDIVGKVNAVEFKRNIMPKATYIETDGQTTADESSDSSVQ